MLSRRRYLLAVSVLAVSFAGCGRSENPWIPLSPEGAGFSISFPAQPKKDEVKLPNGALKHELLAATHNNQLVFAIGYIDGVRVDDIQQTLIRQQATMIQGAGGTLVNEREIHLGQWQGREFSYNAAVGKKPGVFHIRSFIVTDRAYILSVIGHPDLVVDSTVQKFFDSFSVTNQ